METKSNLKICNEVIHPGESLSLALKLPELYSCLPAYMPIKVFHGKEPGPCVLVFAALNGDELNGVEIINRLTRFKRMKKLKGTLIAIPVVNIFGLASNSKYMPGQALLNSNFPGSKTGTHAERVADLFISEIFSLANYSISLETGPLNHSNLPKISTNLLNEDCKELAKLFGAPVIDQVKPRTKTLRAHALENNHNLITYTAGEAKRFDRWAIKLGLQGVLNIMSHLEMIPEKEFKPIKTPPTFISGSSIWVRTPTSGIASSKVKLGAHVAKGKVLCSIHDPFGNYTPQKIASPLEGVVVGVNNVPLVREGEALFQLASFSDFEKAAHHFESWDDQISD